MTKGILNSMLVLVMLFVGVYFYKEGDASMTKITNTAQKQQPNNQEKQTITTEKQERQQPNTTQVKEIIAMNKVENEEKTKLNITVRNQTYVATLEDNLTANTFVANLPMTIRMTDVNKNEKYYVLPEKIRKETAQNPQIINTGDIMCYGDAGLVLFYETFSTSYSYVPIAHMDDANGLEKVLGSGDEEITFSIKEK